MEQTNQVGGFFGTIQLLNGSKFFAGIIMLILNLGSKYISLELTHLQEKILGNPWIRKIVLFTVFFTATHEIITSVILTIIALILIKFLLHNDCSYCLIPNIYKKITPKITDTDFANANKIIEVYNKQKKEKNIYSNYDSIEYMNNNYHYNINKLQKKDA